MHKMLFWGRVFCCLGLAMFLLTAPAGAAWNYVHGHSGHVEGLTSSYVKYYGIDFVPSP